MSHNAFEILDALAKGLDPDSGAALGADGVWSRPEVRDALRQAAASLEASAARANATGKVGQPWTPQEEHELLTAFAAGVAVAELATRHARSLTAIEARLEKLGRLSPEQRVTRNRYVSRPAETDAAQGPAGA